MRGGDDIDTELTRDAEYLLCSVYKTYKEKTKSGTPKANAKFSGSAGYIQKNLMQEWSFADVDETCRELSRAGFLLCDFTDNVTSTSRITDKAIIYMENRFARGLTEILDYMGKIKAAIFF